MASIMTNSSAMTALQTLRKVTGDLEGTQDRISTGLRVNNAKDNAAYWSIATTMKADVAGFKAVTDSLNLGTGTTNTASTAATNIVENLKTLKARVIAGQTNGVDKSLIQDDINQLVQLVKGNAADASFNGDNLLAISYAADGTAKDKNVDILASLSRSAGSVAPSYISFQRQDLQVKSIIGKATIEQQTVSTNANKASVAFDVGAAGSTYINGENLGLGTLTFKITTEEFTGDLDGAGAGTATGTVAPQELTINVDLSAINYDTDQATTEAAIAKAVNDAVATQGYTALSAAYTAAGFTGAGLTGAVGTAAPTDWATADTNLKARLASTAFANVNGSRQLQFTVGVGGDGANYTTKISNVWVDSKESDAFGGLAGLTQLDVVNNASQSLVAINKMLDTAVAKASVIGSIENRVSVQNDFVSKLTDAMNKGVGALVDADMNEESSRLQALQVQQQLAIQALSIANQGPQNILSLFRG